MSLKYQAVIDMINAVPIGVTVEVPRMPTLDRHSVFACVRHNVKAAGYRLSVKTDGAWHYVRRLPISDNTKPDSL
jgi:hypothetical protein